MRLAIEPLRGTCPFLNANSGQNGILSTVRGLHWACPGRHRAETVLLVLVRRVVGVALGAVGVEGGRVGLVDGESFAPASHQIRVGDGGASDDHAVSVAVRDE